MELYFGKSADGKNIVLDEEELHHLIRVRRAAKGDAIDVCDGQGNFYRAVIKEIGKRDCEVEIISSNPVAPPPHRLHLVIAPTKSIDRIEWLLEKATEIGVSEISFIQCRRSERKEIRIDRMEKIVLSAMKQSLKAYLPVIHPMKTIADFLNHLNESGARFICTMDAEEHLSDQKLKQDCIIMIGPEGDFHPDETALSLTKGFQKVSLGKERLRTETAALVSCMVYNLANK